jgi:hypothetical protein
MGWMFPRIMTITMRREVGIGLSLMGILYVLSIFDACSIIGVRFIFLAPRTLVKITAFELFEISTCPVRFTKWYPPTFLPSFLGRFKCDSIELIWTVL